MGGGHTHHTHTQHNYAHRPKLVTDNSGTQIQLHEPSNGNAHTHRRLARGQRVRRVSMDERVGIEPGQRWICATYTASIPEPRSQSRKQVWTYLLNVAYCGA